MSSYTTTYYVFEMQALWAQVAIQWEATLLRHVSFVFVQSEIGGEKVIRIGIICAYNEAATITPVIKGLKKHVDEVLIVLAKKNTDNTDVIAKKLGCSVMYDEGKGKGDAIRLAIDASYRAFIHPGYVKKHKDVVLVFIDADGAHDTRDVPKLLAPVVKGEYEVVIGDRFSGGSDELSGDVNNSVRLILQSIIGIMINLRFHSKVPDAQNGFRAMSCKAAHNLGLKSNAPSIEQEEVINALKLGYRIGSVPAHEYARKVGETRISALKLGHKYFWQIIRDLYLKPRNKL